LLEKEQREQLVSEMEEGMDWEILSFVGMMFQTIFQMKSFKRWFRLSLQRAFHEDLERGRDGVKKNS
jgi:hypothetical protein